MWQADIGEIILAHQFIGQALFLHYANARHIQHPLMPTRLLICGAVSQRWGVKLGAEQENTMCTKRLSMKSKKQNSLDKAVNPDIEYAALHIVLLNINSSIRPSYLKDRTVWTILPIRLLWFNLELHSHSCSSITEWWWGGGLQPRLSQKPLRNVLPTPHCNNTEKNWQPRPYTGTSLQWPNQVLFMP